MLLKKYSGSWSVEQINIFTELS